MQNARGVPSVLALLMALTATSLSHPTRAETPAWKLADPSYRLSLPRDHAAHPDYKIEWWYYTGNLATRDGRRFGYQLTFFRVGVDPAPRNPSRWAVRDLYMAHFAVTDIDRQAHRFADRLNRAGAGWAGARADRYEVWNDGWTATRDGEGRHRLVARNARDDFSRPGPAPGSGSGSGSFGIDLVLTEGKPWVAQGSEGYSQKGSEPGNASHYYSLTRMPTKGTIALDGELFEVEGLSWMDHEFGSSFLEPGQVGWDWFSIQLDDGTELMLYEMRRADGTRDPHTIGTLIAANGTVTLLGAGDFALQPLERWTSKSSGASYPIAWRVAVPGEDLALKVTTMVPAQELRTDRSTRVTYWEGAIEARGTRAGRVVDGRGYLEMTGYSGRSMREVLRWGGGTPTTASSWGEW